MNQTVSKTVHPPIVSEAEWLAKRTELLGEEKELTKHYDRVNAKRRRLPMVKIEKTYVFDGADGEKSLEDLFEGQTQLLVYHFMFDPDWTDGCSGCTGFVNALGDLSMLKERNTNFVLVSRSPYAKLAAYREAHGWTAPWYSSLGSDFNYDYHATLDPRHGPVEYNYKTGNELGPGYDLVDKSEELHGMSVFFRIGHDLFHTYSTYARGDESLTDSYRLLDLTPYGRQEDFEDSPEGWPQKSTYG